MSMMEIIAAMKKKFMGEPNGKPLPWYCLILSDKCIKPETDCIDCNVYEEHKEELIRTGRIAGKMTGGRNDDN